jgi:malonyl-CoA O-methyltransferase
MKADDRPGIDPLRVARLFASPRLNEADDFLQREVAKRMFERLAAIRVDANRIVDLGCGPGRDLVPLGSRFVGSTVFGLDLVASRLRRVEADRPAGLARWLRKDHGPLAMTADFAALPLAAQSVDLLWSNLALHWTSQPHRVLPEWGRVVRTGGLVAFSVFGPDTLREVREAFGAVDHRSHVMPFTDMHDYGDMLVESGFTSPVVDMERLTLTYATADSLWRDVRSLGGNPSFDGPRGLYGRGSGERLARALDATRDGDGRLTLTFELVYAHAWKTEPRVTRAGEAIVQFKRER